MDITEIGDRLEIGQLLVRYVDAIDTKDWDLLDTVFTPDARLDYTSSGGPDAAGDYPTMKAWLQTQLAMFPMTQHLLGQSAITFEGTGDDRVARCRTLFHNPMGAPVNDAGTFDLEGKGIGVFTVGGWYRDTCVPTSDGWRIAEKIEDQAFMRDFPM
ncbi:MAG: nuclear transport factor 2 family protein [Acidimicrobiales bacterium]